MERKFVDWAEGKRVYIDGSEETLIGFDAFDCQTRSLAIPIICTGSGFLSYDPLGEFSQEFVPKYKISIDVKTAYKLSDKRFPSGRTAHLFGLLMEDGQLVADFVTGDRHEHLRYAIKDNVKYAGLDEMPAETVIEYDLAAEKKRKGTKI